MSDTTFAVSPDVKPGTALETVDHIGELRTALRRPIEAAWRPKNRMVAAFFNVIGISEHARVMARID